MERVRGRGPSATGSATPAGKSYFPFGSPFLLGVALVVHLMVRTARVPAAAPIRSHLAARAARWRVLPPLAVRMASSRSLASVEVFVFSSARSDWAAVSFAWQALQSRAKS